MSKDRHIEALVEKFLDGRTTNAEEQELYTWFATADVPEEWAEHKEMFAWYRQGMPETTSLVESAPKPKSRFSLSLRRGVMAISTAVAVAVVAVLIWPSSHKVNIYEGSYIVEAGVRYDDIEVIEDDIEDLFARAELIELEANELIAWADTNF